METLRGAQSSIDQLAQCLSTRSWKVLYREIKVHASNSPPLYIRLRGFICVPVRERSETSSLVRSLRRRHIGDGMERHASFRDWRFSQGVKRLTSVEGAGGRGGAKWKTRRETYWTEGRGQEKERDEDNRWEGWGCGCCHLAMHASSFMSLDSRGSANVTRPSGVRLQQRVRRRITTRAQSRILMLR